MYGGPHNTSSMSMGFGVPIMGMGTSGTIMNNLFMFSGNSVGLQARLQSLTPQEASMIRQVSIRCIGQQIKALDTCCLVSTLVGGCCLIFPISFLFCGWWRKLVYPAHDISQSTYESLRILFSMPSIQSVSLSFQDNLLNARKCQILINHLSMATPLKGFTFTNTAGQYDFQKDQYSNFQAHIKPIKSLPIMSQIKWGTKLVI